MGGLWGVELDEFCMERRGFEAVDYQLSMELFGVVCGCGGCYEV